jgi:hypothetical protein
MPKRIELTDEWGRSGIDITWTPTAHRLDIGGWYDSFVGIGTHGPQLREFFDKLGIETHSLQLREFFDKLGITEKDCTKAFKQTSGKQ